MTLDITTIHESDDPRLAAYRDIREKDLVGRQHQFIAEGKVVLSSLLTSNRFAPQSLLVVAGRLLGLMPLLEKTQPACPIYCVPQKIIDEIAGFHVHRGILGIGARIDLPSLEDFLQSLPQRALVPVLCGISNHDNMGSIFRNAAAFAADGIIVDKTSCDPLYRKSIRVSVGAALKVPYTQGEDIGDILTALNAENFRIYALSPSAPNYLKDAEIADRTALIFGTEGEGLPDFVLRNVETLRIPIAYDFDSLNVATATGLALAHFADFNKLN
ncbi:TrmH family RNA methyltransferase [Bartonella sp. LJL80]